MTELETCISELEPHFKTISLLAKLPSGKEATLYLVQCDEYVRALKVYTVLEQRGFQQMKGYIAGKFYKKSSDRKAVGKWNRYGKNLAHENWIKREYSILKRVHSLGIPAPKVYFRLSTGILMDYIGDEHSPAPKLSDLDCTQEQRMIFGSVILGYIEHLWNGGIVHGDLSPFNVLYYQGTLILIDFPQSIDIRTHPEPETYKERDRATILTWMNKK